MNEDETVEVEETLETPEQEVDETTTEDETEEVDWKAEAQKAKELAENYKKRAEKAEKKPKEPKKETTGLSTTDILALAKADIAEEDMDEVLRWADYNKISVKEALGSSILKSTIAENAEKRQSAQAVNTGSTRRASGNVSDERLLADASKGVMPESDADIQRLARLRFKRK